MGEHQVILDTGDETIVITHRAHSRALFASGALNAARFIADKPAGLYDMRSMVG